MKEIAGADQDPSISARQAPVQAPANPIYTLLDLARRARRADSAAELRFMLVNDTRALAPYRQSGLWLSGLGMQALSGIVQVEANAPYALWLDKVCMHLSASSAQPKRIVAKDLPPELAVEWAEWLPVYALWLPFDGAPSMSTPAGGLLLASEQAWSDQELALLVEWVDSWRLAWCAQFKPPAFGFKLWRHKLLKTLRAPVGVPWWRHGPVLWLMASSLVLLTPVRLTVLAPGELVPAKPAVVRAPLDGVVDLFHVQPNQLVKQGDPLFGFDEALIRSKLDVAYQVLGTAQAEYRQMIQMALADAKSRSQLAALTGKIEEKRAEVLYIEEQLKRSTVLAPQDGVVIFDDPSEWIGRPVSVGERIMRIASPNDVEVEAWVPVADAIPLKQQASLSLFLSASPLSPVAAKLRYFSHDAVQRPDGSYAYRLRASLDAITQHRVGLRGTARIHGDWVPLVYWVLRRPWASMRAILGW